MQALGHGLALVVIADCHQQMMQAMKITELGNIGFAAKDLLAGQPIGDAIETLLSNLKATKTNAELLLRGLR